MSNISDILDVVPAFAELETSPIGLGMAALGRPGYINLGHGSDIPDTDYEAMRQQALAVLDEAYALGIRYFDTAASYGAGEEFLGQWVFDRGYHTSGVTVASKWGYTYTADWQVDARQHEVKEHTLENLNRSLVWSCLRLGQAMKIYQIHSATFESGVLDNTTVLRRLAEIRQDGRLIGLTVSGKRQAELIDRAIDIIIDGKPLFGVVQATWNILEGSAGPALARAKDAGCAIIVKEAMANGRLTQRNTEPGFQDRQTILQQQSERLECTQDALAIAAAINQPWSDVTLSGASNIDQLRSNLGALQVCWDDEAHHLLSEITESAEEYWNKRSALHWN
jgi:aryl-alcohol dehydrogenase-like predicted oxidoreductase